MAHHLDADLRHMTSATHLTSQRSPRVSHRLGSRSPKSIPSSPTSVHSSSSAIFERDIEPTQHRVSSRSKATEQLELSVPSVLDSAASILATPESNDTSALDHVAVVAPAPANLDSIFARSPSSGFASPIGSFRSRSPSPLGLRVASSPAGVTIPLLNIPPPVVISSYSHPPPLTRTLSNPQPTPTIVTESAESSTSSAASSTTATHQQQPMTSSHATTNTTTTTTTTNPTAATTTTTAATNNTLSHPPSPTHGPTKRLSFMSYSDLLSSTPSSTLPLSSLTTSASSMEPPPHIPSVSCLTAITQPPPNSTIASPISAVHNKPTSSAATSIKGFNPRDSMAMQLDDIGGEWEREGLGRGLEERLEALIAIQPLAAGIKS